MPARVYASPAISSIPSGGATLRRSEHRLPERDDAAGGEDRKTVAAEALDGLSEGASARRFSCGVTPMR